jgi:hypothetical protein
LISLSSFRRESNGLQLSLLTYGSVAKHHWGWLNLNVEQKAAIERLAARYIWRKPVAESLSQVRLGRLFSICGQQCSSWHV